MKRRLLVILTALVVLATMTAAPAVATRDRPIRGTQNLELNLGIVTGEGVAPQVSWFGTFDYRGASYSIVYYPVGPPNYITEDLFLFEEEVQIYASLDYELTNGVLTTFEPGELVISFHDWGVGTDRVGFAVGHVTIASGADPHGLLADVSVGDGVFWRGRFTNAAHTQFAGPVWLFP